MWDLITLKKCTSCKINKTSQVVCTNQFCLYKEFYLDLDEYIKNKINEMLSNKNIQKRVSIQIYPENIFNCALPNKSGTTISTQNINKVKQLIERIYGLIYSTRREKERIKLIRFYKFTNKNI